MIKSYYIAGPMFKQSPQFAVMYGRDGVGGGRHKNYAFDLGVFMVVTSNIF